MLNNLEAGLLEILLTQYLKRHGEAMVKEVPVPYLVLRSAQTKLRMMSPNQPSAK